MQYNTTLYRCDFLLLIDCNSILTHIPNKLPSEEETFLFTSLANLFVLISKGKQKYKPFKFHNFRVRLHDLSLTNFFFIFPFIIFFSGVLNRNLKLTI